MVFLILPFKNSPLSLYREEPNIFFKYSTNIALFSTEGFGFSFHSDLGFFFFLFLRDVCLNLTVFLKDTSKQYMDIVLVFLK